MSKKKEELYDLAWTFACSGETEKLLKLLKDYALNINNVIHKAFGLKSSLIMGAYRNHNYDTVEALIDEGGIILPHEVEEIISYIDHKSVAIMRNLIKELLVDSETRNNDLINSYLEKLSRYDDLLNATEK